MDRAVPFSHMRARKSTCSGNVEDIKQPRKRRRRLRQILVFNTGTRRLLKSRLRNSQQRPFHIPSMDFLLRYLPILVATLAALGCTAGIWDKLKPMDLISQKDNPTWYMATEWALERDPLVHDAILLAYSHLLWVLQQTGARHPETDNVLVRRSLTS